MADSLCGPSTALQNFQKHSTVDRTLQQDRLIARQSPSNGFRTAHASAVGQLDPEFEAFQAGQLPLESQQGFNHFPKQHEFQPGPSGWANDFQRLNISTPPQHQQPFNAPIQQRHDVGSWHQDFARQSQIQNAEQRSIAQSGQVGASGYRPYMPMSTGMGMGMQQSSWPGMSSQQELAQQQQHEPEAFDEAAFARAFEEAAQSEREKVEEASSQSVEENQEILLDESAERFMTPESQIPDQARIGADLIHDPLKSSTREGKQRENPDAIAQTAGRLLESVKDNTSAKFQNSQFLDLMRMLRDKEVVVEGNDIVDANNAPAPHINAAEDEFGGRNAAASSWGSVVGNGDGERMESMQNVHFSTQPDDLY